MRQSRPGVAVFVFSAVVCSQAPPLTPITPLALDPNTTPAVIGNGAPPANTPLTVLASFEMRPLGTTGLYRVACCAVLQTSTRPVLLSGTLNLGVTPAAWTADADVDQLNITTVNNTPFQLSMSPDGLVVVWDNYVAGGVSYPPSVAAPANGFVCSRPNTGMPFTTAGVRALFPVRPPLPAGQTFYWLDPHLGLLLPNGRYELFYSDATIGGPGDIVCGQLDPGTGTVSLPRVVRSVAAGVTYHHSPNGHHDSQGRLRALTFGQWLANAPNADILWARNANDTGPSHMIVDGWVAPVTPPGPTGWFSNGCTVGGSFTYPVWSNVLNLQLSPHRVEHVLLADANLCNGESVIGFAPIRPAAVAQQFLSLFGVSGGLAPAPITIPGLAGLLLIDPSNLFGFSAMILHDRHTGIAEWTFGPRTPPGWTFPMQMVTLDLVALQWTFSNMAQVTF